MEWFDWILAVPRALLWLLHVVVPISGPPIDYDLDAELWHVCIFGVMTLVCYLGSALVNHFCWKKRCTHCRGRFEQHRMLWDAEAAPCEVKQLPPSATNDGIWVDYKFRTHYCCPLCRGRLNDGPTDSRLKRFTDQKATV